MWTVAAAHKKATSLLDSYDSQRDRHLAEYFRKRNIRQRLARVGVVESIKPKQATFTNNYCSYEEKESVPTSAERKFQRSKGVTSYKSSDATAEKPKAAAKQCLVSPYLHPAVSSKVQAVPRSRNTEPLPRLPNRSSSTIRCASKMSSSQETSLSEKRSTVTTKTNCEVSLVFHGNRPILQRSAHLQQQHIKVLQQHCGGSSRMVFNSSVARGGTFKFISQRHRGYAFSLVIFVDQLKDIQLSSCCEYRYTKGSRLGGSQGHFSLANVSGGNPCYKCQLEGRMGSLSQPPDLVPKRSQKAEEEANSSKMEKPLDAITVQQETARDSSEKAAKRLESPSLSNKVQGNDKGDYDNYESDDNDFTQPSMSDTESDLSESQSHDENPGSYVVDDSAMLRRGSQDSGSESEIAHQFELARVDNQSSDGKSKDEQRFAAGEQESRDVTDGTCAASQQHVTAVQNQEVKESKIKSTVYFVRDKKNQWGSETARGESFSSDEDVHEAVITVVTADVHVSS